MDTQKIDSPQLLFNTRNELIRVHLGRVAYFEAETNYTYAQFVNGYRVLLPVNLTAMEQLIDKQLSGQVKSFIRIGKRYIVNNNFIQQISLTKQRLFLSDLTSPQVFSLSVSKEALKQLKELYTNKQKTAGTNEYH